MQRWLCSWVVLLCGVALGGQAAVKTIEDGALDKIELFVASLEQPGDLTVAIRPFDASGAELGTGGKDGKESRQQEAKTMQNEGPRVLAERCREGCDRAHACHLRAAANWRHGRRRRRLARQADERFEEHRRRHREVPREVGEGRESQGLNFQTTTFNSL
jgi:hypothetical protein